jgi:hypothetical protein
MPTRLSGSVPRAGTAGISMRAGDPARAGGEVLSARPIPAVVRFPPAAGIAAPSRAPAHALSWACIRPHVPLLIVLALLVVINLVGLPYYALPPAQRLRSPLHTWLKPTGIVGQTAGLGALGLFLFLWLYPLRKKVRWLAITGSMAQWLHVHVLAGLCIPLLAATHAAWRFSGLIGLGFGAMMIAWLSGLVGRYLHSRIPRSRTGLEMGVGEIQAELGRLLEQISASTGLDADLIEHVISEGMSAPVEERTGPLSAFRKMVSDDFRRWRTVRSLRWNWRGTDGRDATLERSVEASVRQLVTREIALGQQLRMLDVTHRLLRYWHVAHKPMAVSALVAVLLHVGVAVAMGVTWFR